MLRRSMNAFGLSCHGVVFLAAAESDFAFPDPTTRARTLSDLRGCIDLCAELGGRIVPIVPRPVGLLGPTAPRADEWGWLQDGLAAGAAHAAAAGIKTGIEALNRFEGYLFNRCADVVAFVSEIEHPGLGVVLDTFHMNIEEPNPATAILAAGDRLIDFQVADSDRSAPGRGHVDWPALANALRAIDYRGALTAELAPPITSIDIKSGRANSSAPPKSATHIDEPEFADQLRETADFLRDFL